MLYGTEVTSSYIIAGLGRTGSYLLCESLELTGVAGLPTEAFKRFNRPIFSKQWKGNPKTIFEYVSLVVKNCTTPNGVFGTKILWPNLGGLQEDTKLREDQNVLDHLFPKSKYIKLFRQDHRGQAISFYRSEYTHNWWQRTNMANTQIIAPDPPYDSEKIRFYEDVIYYQEEEFDRYFERWKIDPLIMYYEDLVDDRKGEVARVLSFIGEDPKLADTIPDPTYIKQADDKTAAWYKLLDQEDEYEQ
jgi:trehalose 2-sulfotransferase